MNNQFRSFGRIIAAKFLPIIAYPVLKGPLKGTRFILGSMSGPGNGASVYINHVEEKQTNEFIKHLKHNSIVFDIGANVGYYTLLAAKHLDSEGKVFAFEPAVRNLSYLYRHLNINKITNVFVLPLACSDRNSIEVFSFDRDASWGHLEKKEANKIEPLSSTFVHTITIDKFVESVSIIPDIMKIDVEGAELLVLNGAIDTLQRYKPKIFLSIHTNQLEFECLEYLKRLGYLTILLDEKERPSVEYLCY